MSGIASVQSIHRYPVKSMAGEQLRSAEIGAGGLVGDRWFALRDLETDRLVSAKRPRQWGRLLDCTAHYEQDEVVVTLPGGSVVSLTDTDALSAHLGRDVAVETFDRPGEAVYASDWPDVEGMIWAGKENLDFSVNIAGGTGFVDVHPIHLITTSALARLGAEASELVVDHRRFRPTMVLDTGAEPGFPENGWVGKSLQIGSATFGVQDATLRCVMVTVAQADLPRQVGVLQALGRINGDDATMHDGERGRIANFGVWTDVSEPGTVSVGDEVRLVG